MAMLDRAQLEFLRSQGLSAEDMFDASAMGSARERIAAMEEAGKRFYFGGAKCGAAGHTLRSKRGQCIQCKTAEIAYTRRHSAPGRLYVAGSLKGRCVKVGTAADPKERLVRLQSERYGGHEDWVVLASTDTVVGAGDLEARVQRQLAGYSREATYMKGDSKQRAHELYRCSFATAATAMLEVVPSGTLHLHCDQRQASSYDW